MPCGADDKAVANNVDKTIPRPIDDDDRSLAIVMARREVREKSWSVWRPDIIRGAPGLAIDARRCGSRDMHARFSPILCALDRSSSAARRVAAAVGRLGLEFWSMDRS
jgi:hypothetical protein